MEGERGIRRARRLGAELQAAEVEGTHGELSSVDELAVQRDGAVLLGLAGGNGLRSERLVVHLLDALAQPEEVAHGQHGISGQEVEEGDHASRALLLEVVAEVGHDDDAVLPVLRQLRLYLEGADALHLVAEEVDAVGILRGEGEDVDDAAAHGILAGFVDIIHALEAVAVQHLGDEGHVHPLVGVQLQGLVGQFGARHHLLGQGVGIGDDAEGRVGPLQAAQHLGAQYLVGGILLPVLDGAAERRGEEQHFRIAQHLHQVVIEIAGFFHIAQDEDKRTEGLPGQHGGEERGRRAHEAPAIDMMNGRRVQQTPHGLHVGMGGIELLQFA